MDQASPRRGSVSGFTLLELMIAVAIVGILLALAAPNFRDALMNARLTAQTNDLMSDLALARSESLKRNLPVILCSSQDGAACGGGWPDGWIVYVDADNSAAVSNGDTVMKIRAAGEGTSTITAQAGKLVVTAVSYRPTGQISGGAEIDFTLCDSRTTPNNGRTVKITVTGRPRVERKTCTS